MLISCFAFVLLHAVIVERKSPLPSWNCNCNIQPFLFSLFKNKFFAHLRYSECQNARMLKTTCFVTHASWWWGVLQAVNRQISLEQQLQTLKENEQALQTLQESLSQLDHTLTSYLTDRIDAFQLPQEAQVQQHSPSHPVAIQLKACYIKTQWDLNEWKDDAHKLVFHAVSLCSSCRLSEQKLLPTSWL